jgi:hypothetical protein
MVMHDNGIFVTYIECLPSTSDVGDSVNLEPTADCNFADLVLIEIKGVKKQTN